VIARVAYDGLVTAFRVVAMTYALSALLIAPGWLSAEEEPAPQPAPVPAAPPAAAPAEDVASAPAPAPAAEPAPAETAPAPAPSSEQPSSDAEPAPPPKSVDDGAQATVAQSEPAEEEDAPVARAAASGSVTIKDFDFSPATITVDVGDTVTWTNAGPSAHTATANDGSFDTGLLSKGQSGSETFSTPGTIAYICTPHPFMKGTVVVKAASSTGSGEDSAAGDPTAPADDTEAAAADDTGGLPATGFETALIALLGAATLGLGLVLRRRAED
jgi:LPXTG-motif cell wall-anchored protein